MSDLYVTRRLADGFPELDQLAAQYFVPLQMARDDAEARVGRLLTLIGRLIEIPLGASMAVIGCGPAPGIIDVLRRRGYQAVGVEPVPEFLDAAREYLGDASAVQCGVAEAIPLPDGSQHLVFAENVLEHVESPLDSLREFYRVLRPGGVVLVTTTNRHKFSLTGRNDEFRVPFFNWLPRLVQESYVFTHLHYRPHLANFTSRPAVHWFSFADLCALGRTAGFAQFYSLLDLRRPDDALSRGPLARLVVPRMLRRIQRSAWLRALALTQLGGDILMWKRVDAARAPAVGTPQAVVASSVTAE